MAKKRIFKQISIVHDCTEDFLKSVIRSKTAPAYYCENIWYPPTDIIETEEEFIVIMEIPGVDKKDISINLTEGILEISGYRYQPGFEKPCKYHSVEIICGHFKRQVALSAEIESSKISAFYNNGLLQIFLPKKKGPFEEEVKIRVEQ